MERGTERCDFMRLRRETLVMQLWQPSWSLDIELLPQFARNTMLFGSTEEMERTVGILWACQWDLHFLWPLSNFGSVQACLGRGNMNIEFFLSFHPFLLAAQIFFSQSETINNKKFRSKWNICKLIMARNPSLIFNKLWFAVRSQILQKTSKFCTEHMMDSDDQTNPKKTYVKVSNQTTS